MPATLQRYQQLTFHEPTYGVEDFRAKMQALLGQDLGLLEDERVCFTSLHDLFENPQKKIDPLTYSLKTLEAFCLAQENQREKTGKTFYDYSLSWMKSGTIRSGKLSTVPTWSPKTVRESSLLDIIELEVPKKYFLSDEQRDRLIAQWVKQGNKVEKPTGALHQIMGGRRQGERVYAVSGESITLSANGHDFGANTGLYMFVDLSKVFKVTDKARCVPTKDRGISNRSGESSEVMAIGNVNPSGKGQNGNVYLVNGLSPTLTTNKGEGIKVAIVQRPRGSTITFLSSLVLHP